MDGIDESSIFDEDSRDLFDEPLTAVGVDVEVTEKYIKLVDYIIHGIIEYNKRETREVPYNDVDGFYCKCKQYLKRYSEYNRCKDNTQHFFYQTYVRGLIQLLKESFLSHRWDDALRIVEVLVKEGDQLKDILWKAGVMCLIMCKKPMTVDLYTRQLCRIVEKRSADVLMDFLLYLIMEEDLDKAKDLFHDFGAVKTGHSESDYYLKNLFIAYIGLIEYMRWKSCKILDVTEEETGIGLITSQLSQGFSQQVFKERGQKAVGYLTVIKWTPGVWDIFVVKLLEIYKFYDTLDEARSLLEEYKAINPDNLNAHRYHYKFEKKHGGKSDQTTQDLKNIVRLDPSNPLALDLYRDLVSSDPEAVSILFNYLDFDHRKNDLQAWELLRGKISEARSETRNCEAVTRNWASRQDWWPHSTLQTDDDMSDDFVMVTRLKKYIHKSLRQNFCNELINDL